MKKSGLMRILSLFLAIPMLISLIGVSNVAYAKAGIFEKNGKISFDENIMLSIFWPPTKDYITDEQYKLIADAGINWVMGSGEESLSTPENQAKMLQLCAKYGIGMTVSDGNFGDSLLKKTEKEITDSVARYENVPSANGFYIKDEPLNPNVYLDAYIALKKAAPDKYMHLNFFPSSVFSSNEMYKAQMNDWCRLTAEAGYPLDYLMFDRYPFPLQAGTMDRNNFFANVRSCYEVGLENDVKTGLYIQTVCQEVAFRRPTDSEIRYEMYASLAFGFKQLSFFTWFTPANRSEPFRDGIISADGKPNAHYETVKTINHEVLNIGSTLVKCDALEVYFNGKDTYGQPSVPSNFFVKAGKDDSVILSFMRHKETGRNYLMVVNNDFGKKQEVELTFDDNIKTLYEVSKSNGKLEALEMNGQKLNLELDAGDGMFIALPEGFDHYKEETSQPEAKTNLALDSLITAKESQGNEGWYISCLQDGRRRSEMNINGWKTRDTDKTYLKIDLKRNLKFNRIDLYPSGNLFTKWTTMPSEISISVSNDGENFTTLKEISDFKAESFDGVKIDVPATEARYIRLDVAGSNGGRYISLNEIEIYNDDGTVPAPEHFDAESTNGLIITYKEGANISLNKQVFFSSTTPEHYKTWGWSSGFINDGKTNNGWTSNVGQNRSPNSVEYIVVDFGDLFNVEKVVLEAQGFFPEDYVVDLSADGVEWISIQDIKGAPDYENGEKINIKLDSLIPARYVRVTGTKLRGGGNDGFLLQLGEIEAYGDPICDKSELENAIATYLSKGGSETKSAYKKAVKGMENAFLTQTHANSLTKALNKLIDSLDDQSTAPETSEGQTESTEHETSVPPEESEESKETEKSETTENSEASSDDNESKGITVVVVVCVCVLVLAVALFVIFKRKSK